MIYANTYFNVSLTSTLKVERNYVKQKRRKRKERKRGTKKEGERERKIQALEYLPGHIAVRGPAQLFVLVHGSAVNANC